MTCGLSAAAAPLRGGPLSGFLGTPIYLAAMLSGCGSAAQQQLDPSQTPRTPGRGAAYHPAVTGRPQQCRPNRGARYGVHLELFARDHVVLIPAGIGVAPPLQTRRPYVLAGSCYADAITREPTGVIEVASHRRTSTPTLGELFTSWGQPLLATRVAAFAGRPVAAFVNGTRASGPAATIRLVPHAEIVLEIGGYVSPHRAYRFPPGL